MGTEKSRKSWDEQINLIFDYVVLNKYPEQCDKNKKANIRYLSKPYVAKSGELYYQKKDKNSNVKEDKLWINCSFHSIENSVRNYNFILKNTYL